MIQPRVPGERPFPVDQVGFADTELREFVGLARPASELARLPPQPPGWEVEALVVTFTTGGDRWRCVTGERRIVLFRTPAGGGDAALAWAHRYATEP